MKIRPVGAELFHADELTDRHDESNTRLSQFFERAKNVRNNKANVTVVTLVEVCWSLQAPRRDISLQLVRSAVSYPNITGLQMLPVMRRATLGCCSPLLC